MSKRRHAGFTLVEVTVALTMAGILIAIILGFMVNSLTQYSITGARAELLNEAQIALDIAANDIRLSANADANNRWDDPNGPGAPGNLLSWESDQDTLILATAAENAAGEILFSDATNYISHKNNSIYFVNGDKLYKRVLAAPNVTGNTAVTSCPANAATSSCPADRLLLQNVDSFSVKYYNEQNQEVVPDEARSVELYVQLKVIRYPESVLAEYKTRMVFRND
jgi:prepilin-type N-terminal cleavage/methylation domain-containing protein